MRVLLVEDDVELAKTLHSGLEEEGFSLDCAYSVKVAKEYLQRKSYSVIVLDKILPDGDGTVFCHELRQKGCNTPLLMLSVCNEVDDIVNGLYSGADDYLTKPFRFAELVARIRTVSKRYSAIKSHIFKVRDLTLNAMSREVKRGGKIVDLRNNEFNLLLLLMKRKNGVVFREEIIEYVWGDENFTDPNLLNVTIYNLRKKIESGNKEDRLIHTIKGIGYKIVD